MRACPIEQRGGRMPRHPDALARHAAKGETKIFWPLYQVPSRRRSQANDTTLFSINRTSVVCRVTPVLQKMKRR